MPYNPNTRSWVTPMRSRGRRRRTPIDARRRRFGLGSRGGYRMGGRYRMYGRTSGPGNPVFKHLKIYNDPFYHWNRAPKIPDGKTQQSIGLANRATFEFEVQSAITNIVLFPGIENAAVIHWNDGTNENYRIITLDDKDMFDFSTTTFPNFGQKGGTALHKWRMVSLGMHISLVNNAEENDGWWEACRVGTPTGANEYHLASVNIGNQVFCYPPRIGELLQANEMSRLPSYVSGDLRDIKYTTFQCKPEGDEHEFIDMRGRYVVPPANLTGALPGTFSRYIGPNIQVAFDTNDRFDSDNELNHGLIQHLIDTSWDSVVIRIHGRIVQPGQIGRNSAIRFQIAQNQEIIYDERSLNSRFHTNSPKAKNLNAAKTQTAAVTSAALNQQKAAKSKKNN